MLDWPNIYRTSVAPLLAAHAAPVPVPIQVLASVAVLVGLALLFLLPAPRNLVGLAPLVLVAFGAWAVLGNRRAVQEGAVGVRIGTVTALRVEKVLTDSTTTAATEAREVHVLELALSEQGTLDAAGAHLHAGSGVERLTTAATIYGGLAVGDRLVGVSLPIAPAHVHLWVREDGRVEP